MQTILVEAAARAEIEDAIAWYFAHDPEIAARLDKDIALAIDRIAKRPDLYRCVYRNLRSCRLMRFPYKIVFRSEDTIVRIIAFFHTRRDPVAWQGRS